ncbi:MAG: T9SS type A sorting domain-containing protein [Ginsengibacter sp.]
MKFNLKIKSLRFKWLFFSSLLAISLNSIGQNRGAVMADPKLGKIELTDLTGYVLDPANLLEDQLIRLKIPVESASHGKPIPAGSCKIKIGFGSKLMLDSQFNLNSAGIGSYFKWTSAINSGQLQVTGELINPLPADLKSVSIDLRVKGTTEGNSTITANFLITNHRTSIILSDEDGANNATSLSYKVSKNINQVAVMPDGDLKLGVFPNPATKDVKSVVIKVAQGKLNGKYKVSLLDITGKLLNAKDLQLNFATNFAYEIGNIVGGQYLIKVVNTDGTQSRVLKFEKL